MTNYNLPPREWYSLEQTIDQIYKLTGETLNISDLIHYWITGRLNISINIFFSSTKIAYNPANSTILEEKNENFIMGNQKFSVNALKIKYFNELQSDGDKKLKNNRTILSYFDIEELSSMKSDLDYPIALSGYYFNDEELTYCGITNAKGLFYLDIHGNADVFNPEFYQLEHIANKNKKIPYDFIACLFQIDNDTGKIISFHLELEGEHYLSFDEFYITKESLELFLKNEEQPTPKKTSTKTKNSQAEFIRNLITIHYGEAIANNIRNELDNPNSDISIDFQNKGLQPVTGKTLDNWINQP
ncbi:hypothetical protein [Mannheimia bovis]|uniref:Uncharacterized protein n=1 Tax=Mannheimia bovis TaxID=2770636 RepID=A0A7H1C158_9PAST|nr:hypothetical protein [Mannheimia bovis]QNS14713.1 hypothetical protein ICJ55_08135 [Mannheimia bovis]